MNNKTCCICNLSNAVIIYSRDNLISNCSRCGTIVTSETSYAALEKRIKEAEKFNPYARYLLSHWIRKNYNNQKSPLRFDYTQIEDIIKHEKLPNIIEQTNNLILILGESIFPYSNFAQKRVEEWEAIIGSINDEELLYIQKILYNDGYIRIPGRNEEELQISSASDRLGLTFKGWEKYNELKSFPTNSNQVFLAMWFNDDTEALRDSLKAAIIAAGYNPLIVDERHFTGNIMDYIIGQIRQSKFLIADFLLSF